VVDLSVVRAEEEQTLAESDDRCKVVWREPEA
jgi:hypothetical protein